MEELKVSSAEASVQAVKDVYALWMVQREIHTNFLIIHNQTASTVHTTKSPDKDQIRAIRALTSTVHVPTDSKLKFVDVS